LAGKLFDRLEWVCSVARINAPLTVWLPNRFLPARLTKRSTPAQNNEMLIESPKAANLPLTFAIVWLLSRGLELN